MQVTPDDSYRTREIKGGGTAELVCVWWTVEDEW